MNAAAYQTRACTLDTLDAGLRAAIRAHETELALEDIESDILMCCETITVHQKKGFFGGIKTTLSAVYVTPKWLVWADSTGPNDVAVGTAQLSQINVRDYRITSQYAIPAEQGLNIAGRHTDKNKTGITFIVLEAGANGQKFRQVLQEVLRSTVKL
jgi:hypothetical protein